MCGRCDCPHQTACVIIVATWSYYFNFLLKFEKCDGFCDREGEGAASPFGGGTNDRWLMIEISNLSSPFAYLLSSYLLTFFLFVHTFDFARRPPPPTCYTLAYFILLFPFDLWSSKPNYPRSLAFPIAKAIGALQLYHPPITSIQRGPTGFYTGSWSILYTFWNLLSKDLSQTAYKILQLQKKIQLDHPVQSHLIKFLSGSVYRMHIV